MSHPSARQPYDTREVQDLLRLIEAESIPWEDITRRAGEQGQGVNTVPKFVPKGRIERHFKQSNFRIVNNLLAVIFGPNQYEVSAKDLAETCSRVFCILILIGKPKLIERFVDEEPLWDKALPLVAVDPPPGFPQDPNDVRVYKRFQDAQWQFCALEIRSLSRQNVPDQRILPFTHSEQIGGGGTAFVHKVTLHADHDGLKPPSPSSHVYVIKTFKKVNAAGNFDREVAAFRQVTDAGIRSAAGLIEFYGGFRYRGTFNIVLQYADAGTLENIFEQDQPPTSGEEIISFWSNLFEIIKGICQIHEQHLHRDKRPRMISTGVLRQGWHQDIKPTNILALNDNNTPNTSVPSNFPKSFKIADLGQCHFKTILAGGFEEEDFDTFGTQTYGAPECYQKTAFSEHRPHLIKRNVDIWSLGCVFAEAYVWVVKGWQGLAAFRTVRKRATEAIDASSDLPLGDCFHDGYQLLKEVQSYLEEIKRDFKRGDYASGRVLEQIIYPTLQQNPDDRPSARGLQTSAEILIRGARKELQRPPVATSSIVTSIPNQNHLVSTPGSQPISSQTQGPGGHNGTSFSGGLPTWNLNREGAIYSSPQGTQTEYLPLSASPPELAPGQEFSSTSQQFPTRTSVPDPNSSRGPQSGIHEGIPAATRTTTSGHLGTGSDPFHSSSSPPGLGNGLNLQQMRSDVPYWSVEDAKAWREKQRHRSSSLTGRARGLFTPRKKGQEMKAETTHWHELEGRDHVFFIDDSATISPIWHDVAELADLLTYMTKSMDPDGVELYFLSANESHGTFTNSSELSKAIKKHTPTASTNLNQCFDTHIRKYGRAVETNSRMLNGQPPRKRSIYVLTDGVFSHGMDNDGHAAIRFLVDKLTDAELPRGQIGIQFIAFGNNAAGRKRLRTLDSLGLKLDVVDTVHASKNVWKMLLGAINEKFDNDDDDEDDIPASPPLPTRVPS